MTDYPFNWDKPVKADTIANFCTYTEQNPEHILRGLFGFVQRPKFRWKDADEIYIGPGCYYHSGSTRERLVWWTSELTFKLGSGGSNAASDDLTASAWHYIFIDDSAVNSLASNELTAAEFLNDTTAPTWSDAKRGYYTDNDRCIFAVLTDSSKNILEFLHDGGTMITFADSILEANGITPSSSWTDVDMATSVPAISTKAKIHVLGGYVGAANLYWRTNGQTGATGHWAGVVGSTTTSLSTQLDVITDTSQIIEVKWDAAEANTIYINTDGWYLPVGM